MLGDRTRVGILPRTLNELFSLRRQLGFVLSMCVYEIMGDTITDVLTTGTLSSLAIPPVQVTTRVVVEKLVVHEVLLVDRVQGFQVLHSVLKQWQVRTNNTAHGRKGSPCTWFGPWCEHCRHWGLEQAVEQAGNGTTITS